MDAETCMFASLDHKLLDVQSERRLLAAAQNGDKQSLEKIIQYNQRLVYRIANRYHRFGYGGDQELIDLMQWGNIGLLNAIRKWDGRDVKFSTYATYWIQAYVRRFALIKGMTFAITYYQAERMGNIRASRVRLTHKRNREPTAYEIANDVDVKVEDVVFITEIARKFVRLDAEPSPPSGDFEYGDTLYNVIEDPDAQDPEKMTDLMNLKQAFVHLSDQEQDVIVHRYGFDDEKIETYENIAKRHGVSREEIRQTEKNALAKLRKVIL